MSELDDIVLRSPTIEDGMVAFRLVGKCPPLDVNSSYCYFLQCSHFASTSVVAVKGRQLVGFISGYSVSERADTLFVWQVAVDEQARGLGLASQMLAHILARPQCAAVHFLETTITETNQAPWTLFKALANKRSADVQSSI